MPLILDDTIAAIASPPGAGARGIVRVSGPDAVGCALAVFRPAQAIAAMARPSAVSGEFRLPSWGAALPGEVFVWPERRSYTGQAVVEMHTLGSPPLLQSLLHAVCAAGARLAGPGEFTLRAFLTGRIDLTQAEAVAGVIDAADPAQLDTALAQLAGGLARPLAGLRSELLDLLAELEAGFDFPDEDLPFLDRASLVARLAAVREAVGRLQSQVQSRAVANDLFRVVLVGSPNVGKSSLFNALTGARALVSELPGTTRDYLAARLDLDGAACLLIDTAGHERARAECGSDLLQAALAMTEEQGHEADLRVLCLDASRALNAAERAILARPDDRRIVVLTKTDAALAQVPGLPEGALLTSSVARGGLGALRGAIRARLVARPRAAAVAGTAARCRESLHLAGESLERALRLADGAEAEELLAAEIRAALEEIGKVAGQVYTEDLLEVIFSRFCIGK